MLDLNGDLHGKGVAGLVKDHVQEAQVLRRARGRHKHPKVVAADVLVAVPIRQHVRPIAHRERGRWVDEFVDAKKSLPLVQVCVCVCARACVGVRMRVRSCVCGCVCVLEDDFNGAMAKSL